MPRELHTARVAREGGALATSIHEAGHTVAQCAFYGSVLLVRMDSEGAVREGATKMRRHLLNAYNVNRMLRRIRTEPDAARAMMLERCIRARLWTTLAGPLAEEMIVGPTHSGEHSQSDMLEIERIVDGSARISLAREKRATLQFLERHWSHVTTIACRLRDAPPIDIGLAKRQRCLLGGEVDEILSSLPTVARPAWAVPPKSRVRSAGTKVAA